MIIFMIAVYGLAVAGLLVCELRGLRRGQIVFKSLAAFGFCAIALAGGALSTPYGQLIFAALLACAAGDMCLLPRGRPALFKLGMAFFALGHTIYIMAFMASGDLTFPHIGAVIGLGLFGVFMSRYLWPHLPNDMKIPVFIYNVIILAMVLMAIAAGHKILIMAAIMFALSDAFVGRDRFVSPDPRNALLISPLYFGAQLLFALSAAQA